MRKTFPLFLLLGSLLLPACGKDQTVAQLLLVQA